MLESDINQIPEELRNVVYLFAEDGELRDCYMDNNRMFINGYKENPAKLYLRFIKKNKVIVIANIEFKHKRNGYCTRLLSLLNDYALANGYEIIEIENAISTEMKNFARKHDFIIKNETYGMCWIKNVSRSNKDANELYGENIRNFSKNID